MKIKKVAPILSALILGACHHAPPPGPVAAVSSPPLPVSGSAQGIDLPTDASDVLNELRDNPITFVARYYREPDSRWPPLSAGEAQRLSSLGVEIVAVWEPYSPNPARFSYASGYADALSAYRQAKTVGQPTGSAIYFAVDYNARALEPIAQYFIGVAAGLAAASGGAPEYEVGVYGSGAVCAAIKQAGLARYTWLSNSLAWAGSTTYDAWDIRQEDRLAGLSFNHDGDEARGDYGGFRLAAPEIAAPDSGPYAGPASGEVAAPSGPPGKRQMTSLLVPGL